jgi:hypothetical protein
VSAAEFNAVKDWLASYPALSAPNKVSDTVRRNADGTYVADTYCVLFGGAPDELNDDRFTGVQAPESTAEYVHTVRCVSTTASGCRNLVSLVTKHMVGHKPVVAGRKTDPLRLTFARDVESDDSIRTVLFFSDLEFTWTSRRPQLEVQP